MLSHASRLGLGSVLGDCCTEREVGIDGYVSVMQGSGLAGISGISSLFRCPSGLFFHPTMPFWPWRADMAKSQVQWCLQLWSLVQDCVGILSLVCFRIKFCIITFFFSNFCGGCHWYFEGDFIETLNPSGKYDYLNSIYYNSRVQIFVLLMSSAIYLINVL